MSETLTQDELDRLQALADAATPGPWTWGDDDEMWGPPTPTDAQESYELDEDDTFLYQPGQKRIRIIATDSGYYPPREADQAFIAEAREALPKLIAEVRRLQALLPREVEP